MRSRLRLTLALDEAVLRALCRWQRPVTARLARALTHVGDAASWIVLGLALIACGGAARQAGLLLGVAAVAVTVIVQPLKRLCRRPRPRLGIGHTVAALAEDPDAFSFPSGHAATAFAVAVALSGQANPLVALALVLAFGISLSRVYLGAHYPLDVAVGALIGALTGTAVRVLLG